MPGLNDLHSSYLKNVNTFTRTAGRKKVDVKKDDEHEFHSTNTAFHQEKVVEFPTFPITPTMLLLSLIFWLCVSVLIYYSITYGLLLSRITDEADLHGTCSDGFNKNKTENMMRVQNYQAGIAVPYLLRLRPSKKKDYPIESKVLPPLVTGITSAQFYQFQGLVRHIQVDIKRSQPDLKLIVYDLGLYKRERELLQQYCQCEVRNLNFEKYPVHVSSISNYAWRPIIIQLVLEEYGSVIYVEPTTRFKSSTSPNYLRMRGSRNYYVWDPLAYTSLVAYTDKGMFEYFNESRCAFLDCSLLTSEAIAVYRTEATWAELMKPWLTCALNEDCIAPKYAIFSGCIELRNPRTTGCHRFDMSALSLILNRGIQYTVDSEQMVSFRLTYTDIVDVAYFPEQPWTYTQLFLLVLAPIFIVFAYKYAFRKKRFCRL